ncbi:hypothetical protein FQZ97_1049780 [compost metagenome]
MFERIFNKYDQQHGGNTHLFRLFQVKKQRKPVFQAYFFKLYVIFDIAEFFIERYKRIAALVDGIPEQFRQLQQQAR